MTHRCCGTAIVTTVVWLTVIPAAGQTLSATPTARAAGTAGTWMPARTPDGQPDIRGIWEGGGGFDARIEKGVEPPQTTAGPADLLGRDASGAPNCRSLGSPVGTICASYPALWTNAGRSGLLDGPGEPNQPTAPRRPSGLIDLPDGKLPWTPWGTVRRQDIYDHFYEPPSLAYVDPSVRCILGVARGGGPYQFLQIPGYFVMLYESNHATRIIPLDGRPHLGPDVRLFMGDSVGRWEGTTLVVDTTNFTGNGWFDMVGTPQSDALHVIERLTIVDADTIDYVVTFDDPKLFTKPWTFGSSFTRTRTEGMQTTELLEHACAEGSQALENILERPGKPLPPEKFMPR